MNQSIDLLTTICCTAVFIFTNNWVFLGGRTSESQSHHQYKGHWIIFKDLQEEIIDKLLEIISVWLRSMMPLARSMVQCGMRLGYVRNWYLPIHVFAFSSNIY